MDDESDELAANSKTVKQSNTGQIILRQTATKLIVQTQWFCAHMQQTLHAVRVFCVRNIIFVDFLKFWSTRKMGLLVTIATDGQISN